MPEHTTLVRSTASPSCTAVGADDEVTVTAGRHAGTVGVLVRAAAAHQAHHVVRLAGGSQVRISVVYVHRAGCPVLARRAGAA